MRVFALLTVALFLFLSIRPTHAGDIKSDLKAYGLVGTFSHDCSKSIAQGGDTVTYVIPNSGEPTVTMRNSLGVFAYIIKEANIAIDGTIVLKEVSVDGKTQTDLVMQKTGTGIRPIQVVAQVRGIDQPLVLVDNGLNTRDGTPAPIRERCGN
jgi:hypothetical protein